MAVFGQAVRCRQASVAQARLSPLKRARAKASGFTRGICSKKNDVFEFKGFELEFLENRCS